MFQSGRTKYAVSLLVLSCLCIACFGGKPKPLEITNSSVGPIDGQTPYDRAHFEEVFKGYSVGTGALQTGSETLETVKVYLDGSEMLEIIPGRGGTAIDRVAVLSPEITDPNGNHVGSGYTSVFAETPPQNVIPGMSEYTGHVLCPAPGLSNITYIFHGDYTGPPGVVPPQNVLDSWSIKVILWKS
jgi:hypothetical protein